MPTTRRVVTAMFSLAVFALCASAPAAPQTKQLPVVKIGTTGSLDSVALQLALEQGLYEEEGNRRKAGSAFPDRRRNT